MANEQLAENSISISELDELQASEVQLTDKLLVERDDVIHSLNVGNIREVVGVELNELDPSITQGAVNTNPSVNVTAKSTDTSNHRRFNIDFTLPKANQIESTTVTQNNNDSGTSNIAIGLSDGSTKSLNIKNGKGIASITQDNNTANGATRAITVTYSDNSTSSLSVKNGEGIDSVTVNQSSSAGATSTMTLTMSNGTTQTLSVKNGKDFHIAKSYASIAEMVLDFANMDEYDFVMIDTGSVEDVDTGKLYYKGASAWQYVGDLSGKQGIKGDTGVGIASLSFSESQVSSGINVLTVTLTDGTTQTFNIRNGAQGDTGERGTGVFAGTDFSITGTSYIGGAGETICDQGLLIDSHTNSSSYTTSYKAGDIYIQTATNDVFKAVETVKSMGSGASFYFLYWLRIGNIQGKSVGSITSPSTIDTSAGAGNTYTVKDTDGNAIGTFTVYNANNSTANTLATARTFTIADADGTNSGVSVSFDGSGNVTLHLPSTAKINITGNAATATNADTVDGYHASDLAKGNLRVYHRVFSPQEINTPATLSNIVSGYGDGSLICFRVNWENYQSYPYAGFSGIIVCPGASSRAFGLFRNYDTHGFYKGFHWSDAVTESRFSGFYNLTIPKATTADKIRTSAPSSPSAGDIWIS